MIEVGAQRLNVGRIPLLMVFACAAVTMVWWALAFYPVTSVSPEWLALAKTVCFGMSESGLPASYGWILLLLGPASLVLAIKLTFGDELKISRELVRSSTNYRAIAGILMITFLWETVWVGFRIYDGVKASTFSYAPAELGELPEGYPRGVVPAPNFNLVDQSGTEVSLATLKGNNVILTYVFAHCLTVCPVLVKNILDAKVKLDPATTKVVFMTLDPWRDTPDSLSFLAEEWKLPAGALILSGKPKEVTKVLDSYNVPWKRNEKTGDVVHPALVNILDKEGRTAYSFNNPPANWLVEAVKRLN